LLEQRLEFQSKWLFLDELDMRFGASFSVHYTNKKLFFVGVDKLDRSSNLIDAYWEVPVGE